MVARVDRTTDPEVLADLLLARQGTAYFLRKLKELGDDQFAGDSLLAGWSRSHVVAHVGYNARALSRLAAWAATGVETPMYTSTAVRDHEIEFGSTLTPNALRNLAEHSAVHLNVEWRDLPPERWSMPVRTVQGREVPAAETAWLRTREVWLHAIDLNNGGRFEDVPEPVLERLLADVVAVWRGRVDVPALRLQSGADGSVLDAGSGGDPVVVSAPLPGLVAWATGRRRGGVVVDGRHGELFTAPRWI